jgi:hypothetical protein
LPNKGKIADLLLDVNLQTIRRVTDVELELPA